MFGLFKKKPKEKRPPLLQDLNGEPLSEGDIVMSKRYDLGRCRLSLEGLEYIYEALESDEKVSYVRMIDAITGHQKVLKEKPEKGTT